jgi:hypothetical protein
MGNAVPTVHPAVVLRSHYTLVRALLAVAMIAVVGLTAAVVMLATREDSDTVAGSAAQLTAPAPTGDIRYDGGPEEGTRGALSPVQPASPPATTRYDGGPEEGSADVAPSHPRPTEEQAFPGLARQASGPQQHRLRYDGGPEEGTRGAGQ